MPFPNDVVMVVQVARDSGVYTRLGGRGFLHFLRHGNGWATFS